MRPIPQAELQQDLQRFQGRFVTRLAEALAPLDKDPDPAIRRAGLELQLRLESAALDIAVGPDTDANLLDMVALVELAANVAEGPAVKAALEKYGVSLDQSIKKISDDVWQIARKELSGPEEQQLRRIIERWKVENPDLLRVAAIRLSAFSNPQASGFNTAGGDATGLLAGMKRAVQSADEVRLLAERALFAVQRLPFLLRMHVRVATLVGMADVRGELVPALATVRRVVGGAVLVSGLLGLGLLVFLPRARRRWR